MEIWLQTIDAALIEKAGRMGLLHGVDTDPDMLAKSPHALEMVSLVLAKQSGPVAVQVSAGSSEEMAVQGKILSELSARIVVKVPATSESWEAVRLLAKEGIPVMTSAIYHPSQALLAAKCGAAYLSLPFTRLLKAGDNPLAQLEAIRKMIDNYGFGAKIIASSVKTIEHVSSCAQIGIAAAALREDLFADLTDTHELTAFAVEQLGGGCILTRSDLQ